MNIDAEKDQLPKYTWWVLGLTAIILLGLTVTAIGFISAGYFDPRPIGQLTAYRTLKPQYVPGQSEYFQWLNEPPLAADFRIRLTAAYGSGDKNAAYGLALRDEETVWITAISPPGYVTIREYERPFSSRTEDADDLNNMIANGPGIETFASNSASGTATIEWQPWPHVHRDKEANEIWVDKKEDTLTVYINRELLWRGSTLSTFSTIALYSASFDGFTTIDFQTLEIYLE